MENPRHPYPCGLEEPRGCPGRRMRAAGDTEAPGSASEKSGDRMEKLRAKAKQRRKEKKEGKKRKTNRYV